MITHGRGYLFGMNDDEVEGVNQEIGLDLKVAESEETYE